VTYLELTLTQLVANSHKQPSQHISPRSVASIGPIAVARGMLHYARISRLQKLAAYFRVLGELGK
jgi:hypothetical protein